MSSGFVRQIQAFLGVKRFETLRHNIQEIRARKSKPTKVVLRIRDPVLFFFSGSGLEKI
jgi:hypothetical protein